MMKSRLCGREKCCMISFDLGFSQATSLAAGTIPPRVSILDPDYRGKYLRGHGR